MVERNPSAKLEPQDEVARLLALMLRRTYETQTEFIVELSKVGFPNNRIAQFADTSVDTVGATLRGRKKQTTRKRRPKPASGG